MKRLLFELLCIFVVIGIPPAVKFYNLYGWVFITLIGYLSTIVDYFCFPYLKKNLNLLEINGFQQKYVWMIMFLNLILTNALVGVIYKFSVIEEWNWFVPIQVFINMLITELTFTISHMLLHYTHIGAQIHKMHHCCKQASWSTNLVFHPLDMAAEFSGPVVSTLLMHHYIWKNNTTLIFTVLTVHLWYALDHSATLKLPHTKHHSQINSLFTIYLKKYYTFKTPELVKNIINTKNN